MIAQKALSAVYRTGQRFGVAYLVDFLRGSESMKIRDEHKNLKTYGVGADITKDHWFDYFKDLIAQGYLALNEGQFPTIALTETSMDVLAGKTPVELIKLKIKEPKRKMLAPDVEHPHIPELFDALRQLRTVFARNENVPPYVVFSDATLVEMAIYLPQNDWELKKISGVGDLKFDKYGADFLNEIRNYCSRNNLVSRIDLKSPKRERNQRTKRDATGRDTYRTTFDLFQDGKSMDEIAKERGLGLSTVEGHLARFVGSGEIALDELVPVEKIETIREAILEHGGEGMIGPVKTALGDNFSYGEIRAVRAAIEATAAEKSKGAF